MIVIAMFETYTIGVMNLKQYSELRQKTQLPELPRIIWIQEYDEQHECPGELSNVILHLPPGVPTDTILQVATIFRDKYNRLEGILDDLNEADAEALIETYLKQAKE